MDNLIWIVAIIVGLPIVVVIGLPIVGAFIVGGMEITKRWFLKSRELKLKEKELKVEERLRTDQLNAQILRMDDFGISPSEISALRDEVRRLREEVAEIRQELGNRNAVG